MGDRAQRLSAEVIPASGSKADARKALEQLGFTVQDQGASLTIEGERQTFERALGVGVEVNPEAAPGEATATPSGEPELPDEVRELVDAVAFPKRAHMLEPRTGERRKSNA